MNIIVIISSCVADAFSAVYYRWPGMTQFIKYDDELSILNESIFHILGNKTNNEIHNFISYTYIS